VATTVTTNTIETLKNIAETHIEKRLVRENLDACEEEIYLSFIAVLGTAREEIAIRETKRIMRYLRENLGV
jgi:hypothetical protein